MAGESCDCVGVGAGPGGISAALVMARAGLQVLVLERGEYPGAKNVMGGLLFRKSLEGLIPEFWKDAPVERHVTGHELWLTTEDGSVALSYRSTRHDRPPFNGFTVQRAKFDGWFASNAEQAGAMVVPKTVVMDLLWEHGRVAGVKTEGEGPDTEVRAGCVILADGVNSLLMSKAKLRAHDLKPHQVTLCVKEVIGFPRETIESRFNLEGDQGLAVQMLGGVTKGLTGMGFLYTNRDAGAGGLGVVLKDLVSSLVKPYELLEHLKAHPRVRPLIAGGETLEYTAHMIPAGGFPEMPRLAGDGVLAVGDAGMLVNSVSWEGANFAMESGRLAGETVVEAKQAGDFSARTLGRYQGRLEASFVLKDLRHFGNTIPYVETHPHFFGVYPGMAVAAAEEFFTVDGVPKKEKERKILRAVHARRPVWRIVWDLVRAWGSLR